MRASEGAEHPTELTRDHLRLRDQLLALEPSARPADTTRALARAAQLLAASSHARKTVFLLSLLAKTGLRGDEPPWGKDGPALVAARSARRRRCRTSRSPRCTSIPIRAPARAASRSMPRSATSATTPAKVELSLAIARSRRRARRRSTLAPHEQQDEALPRGAAGRRARDRRARSSLAGDALAIDDRRWVRATLRDEVRVLLVDGDPRTVRHDDELFYLEAALRPGDREDSGTSVRSITAEELAGIDPSSRARRRRSISTTSTSSCSRTSPALPAERVAVLADVGARRRRHPRRARRSRRPGRVRPHDAAAAAAEPARSDRHHVGRVARGARQPRAAPREVGSRPPDLRAVLEGRARARRREVLQDLAARPDDRDRGSQGARALHERRRRARRGVDRRRPHAAVHVDARPRLERPADPSRVPAADPAGGAPPRAQARARHRRRSPRRRARSRCRPAISRSSRSAAPTASARCSKAIASPAAARVRFAQHRSPGHLPRDRHRSDRRDARARRARVRGQPRSARLRPHARAAADAAGLRHRQRGRARPTTRAASSCGTRSRRSVLLLLLAEGVLVQR